MVNVLFDEVALPQAHVWSTGILMIVYWIARQKKKYSKKSGGVVVHNNLNDLSTSP